MKGSVLGIGDSKHPVLSLQHEALDRTTKIVDAAGTTKYSYYAGGLLKTEDGPWANDTMSYSYNNARLRSGLVLQQPTGTWTNGLGNGKRETGQTVGWFGGNDLPSAAAPFFGLSGSPLAINF